MLWTVDLFNLSSLVSLWREIAILFVVDRGRDIFLSHVEHAREVGHINHVTKHSADYSPILSLYTTKYFHYFITTIWITLQMCTSCLCDNGWYIFPGLYYLYHSKFSASVSPWTNRIDPLSHRHIVAGSRKPYLLQSSSLCSSPLFDRTDRKRWWAAIWAIGDVLASFCHSHLQERP